MRSVLLVGVLAFLASVAVGPTNATYELLCAPCPSASKFQCKSSHNNCYYNITGSEITMDFQDTVNLVLNCNGYDISIDDHALPAAQKLLEVKSVTIRHCQVPSNGSYHEALKAINFTMANNSKLHLVLPENPTLKSHHLHDLALSDLHIEAKNPLVPLRPAGDYLKYVSGLRSLKLENVIPEAIESDSFPLELEELNLKYTRLAEHTNGSAWLERLQSLSNFYLQERMNAYSTKILLTLPELYLLPKLKVISLHYVPLDLNTLNGGLNGSSVNILNLNSCGLSNLSNEMFIGANLTKLSIINNKLAVPQGGLSGLQYLTTLDVSNTGLDAKALLRMVSPLKRLVTLTATNNPLGSLCGDADEISTNCLQEQYLTVTSRLPKTLQKLDLRGTGASRICPDWIQNSALMEIDLKQNDISNLTINELMMKREAPGIVKLNLAGNSKLRMTGVSSVDVELCRNDTSYSEYPDNLKRVLVRVKLKKLTCDCTSQYWFPEALRRCPLLKFEDFEGCITEPPDFAASRFVADNPKEILCPYNSLCSPNCSCWKRSRDNATVVQCAGALALGQWQPSTLGKLVVHAAPGAMAGVPRIALVELHAPNNNITTLDVEDIPNSLRVLDVRNNSIEHISEAAARKLRDIGTHVTLAGNRLACACSDAPAFELLKFVIHDWNEIQCVDQSLLSVKMESGLCTFAILPILLTLSLLMFIVALLLDIYKLQVRNTLFKLNLCRRYIYKVNDNADDGDKTVDVFLSYACTDIETLREIKSGLEARGYSTLDHSLDWQPGKAIKEQISRSVLCARRTLLLVSDNYAKSKWALEEFHAAHAHAMERQTARVLVVRLDLNEPDKLPSNLRTYIKYHTYLDWRDIRFWPKLCQYMPPKS